MALGTRHAERQTGFWIPTGELAPAPVHPFCRKLNEVLAERGFDRFVEEQCRRLYAEHVGRPGIPPGVFFLEARGGRKPVIAFPVIVAAAFLCGFLCVAQFLARGSQMPGDSPEFQCLKRQFDTFCPFASFVWNIDDDPIYGDPFPQGIGPYVKFGVTCGITYACVATALFLPLMIAIVFVRRRTANGNTGGE
jgi:hypothetical protein